MVWKRKRDSPNSASANKRNKKNSPKNCVINNNNNQKMNSKCGECKEDFVANNIKLKCSLCYTLFHIECVGMSRTKLKTIQTNTWICSSVCGKPTEKSSSIRSSSESEHETMHDAFVSNNETPNFTDVVRSVQFMSDKLDGILQKDREIRKMLLNFQRMETRVSELEIEVERLKQERNDGIMLMTGVPERPEENLKDFTVEIAKKINVNMDPRDIVEISRLKAKVRSETHSKFPPPILINLIHPIFKQRLMAAKKENGPLYVKQLLPNYQNVDPTATVNFRSFLTAKNMELLNQARTLKESGYNFIWFANNKVQVRKDKNSRVIHIKTKSDVELLSKNEKNEKKKSQ